MKCITVSKTFKAIVDDQDYEHLAQFKWYRKPIGHTAYAVRCLPGADRHMAMHREILQPPSGMTVDHINGDGLDNRRANLRVCTQQQNSYNQVRVRGKSRFKGVCRASGCDRWRAQITINYERRYLGIFKTEEEAARAYNEAAKQLFGEYARLNAI